MFINVVLERLRNTMNSIIDASRVTKTPIINPNTPVITIDSVQESLVVVDRAASLGTLCEETV